MPRVDLAHKFVKLDGLIRAQDLPEARARFQVNGLELRVDLLLQISYLLRSLIENIWPACCTWVSDRFSALLRRAPGTADRD